MLNNIGYKKTYKMRKLVKGAKHITVGIPYEVIEREATMRGLSVDYFLEQFMVTAEYDNFEGVHYSFVEAKPDEREPLTP